MKFKKDLFNDMRDPNNYKCSFCYVAIKNCVYC